MARWKAALIITIGLEVAWLSPAWHCSTQPWAERRPHVPVRPLAASIVTSVLLTLVALSLPTRHALRIRPIEAIAAVDWH